METILDIQQRIKSWFVNYESYLLPAVKGLTMLAVLLLMNWHLGYRLVLMRWILVILVSLVCALLPWSGMTAVAGIYLLGHVSALSWEAAVVLAVLMFVGVLLHYLFLPGGSFLIVLVPLACYLRIPYVIPLLVGLFGTGLSFIPVGIGVVIYYTMAGLEKNAMVLLDVTKGIPDRFLTVLNILRDNRSLVIAVVAFCLVTLAVCALNRLSLDYMKYISVAAGGILMLLIHMIGASILMVPVPYGSMILGCVVSVLLALFVSFWTGALDYSRPEFLKYEDDEYQYYVKAIPKMVVQKSDRRLQEISSRKEKAERKAPDTAEAGAE